MAVMWTLVLATNDLPESVRLLAGDVRPRWVRSDLLRLARLSIPLGVTAMFISLSATIPRYFIERHRGEDEAPLRVGALHQGRVGGVVHGLFKTYPA